MRTDDDRVSLVSHDADSRREAVNERREGGQPREAEGVDDLAAGRVEAERADSR